MDLNEHEEKTARKIEFILEENQSGSELYTVRDLMYFDTRIFLSGLLHVEDKISMSMGLEVRVPFLDQDVVDFSLTLPENLLIDTRDPDDTKGKIVLREWMNKYQIGVSCGKKQGFTGPDEIWFKNPKHVSKFINEKSNIWNYINREDTLLELEQHYLGKSNRRLLIWSLIQLEITTRGI